MMKVVLFCCFSINGFGLRLKDGPESGAREFSEKSMRPKAKHAWEAKYGCDTPPPAGSKFYSQVDEDVELYSALFCGKTQGTFIEMGAVDGLLVSNTKFFDDHMGWSGLLIEATPKTGAKIEGNRPNPRNMIYQGGVCPDEQGTMEFEVAGKGKQGTNGMPSQMSDTHKKRWFGKGSSQVVQVQCKSMTSLMNDFLAKSGEDHIDFWSLDVEGAELFVLNNFDFKVPVKHILVEIDDAGVISDERREKDQKVKDFLKEHGYEQDQRFPKFGSEVWSLQ